MLWSTTGNLILSSYGSRGASMFVNYNMNKSIVFNHKGKHKVAFIKYLILAIFSITTSYFLLTLVKNINLSVWLFKLLIEIALFFVNFYIQNKFIFRNKLPNTK
jgi:putative flippase GtrA